MFALNGQVVSSMGNAYAGTAVNIGDSSVGYSNPAGLATLKNHQVSLAGFLHHDTLKVSSMNALTTDGNQVIGLNPAKSKVNYLIPGLHAAVKANRYLTLGLNCTSPYGFKTSLAPSSIVRYKDVASKLTSYDLSPSVGIKLSSAYYLGIGLDWLQLTTTLQNYISETTLQTIKASGNQLGFHAGVLWIPSKLMRIGLTYHSGFNVKLKGSLKSAAVDQSITSRLKLPDKIVYSIVADVEPDWSMMANIERVNWSRLKDFTVEKSNATYVTTSWLLKDTWRFALGFDYRVRAWILKCGFAFEQGANRARQTTLRVPDSNSYQLACGLSYGFNKNFSIDFGYAHLFYRGAKITQSGFQTNTGVTADTLNGGYESSIDILGIQLNLKIA